MKYCCKSCKEFKTNKILLDKLKEPGLVDLVNHYVDEIYKEEYEIIKNDFYGNWSMYTSTNYCEETFLKINKNERINWRYISTYRKFSEDFVRDLQDKLDWDTLSRYSVPEFSDSAVEEFEHKIRWSQVSKANLKLRFLNKYQYKVNWDIISSRRYHHLNEQFIIKYQDKVDWPTISREQILSEDFIRKFKDKVDWFLISKHQRFSEDFIREFKHKIHWRVISEHKKLSNDFIGEFKNNVNWKIISKHQNLSDDFIRKYQEYIDFSEIIIKKMRHYVFKTLDNKKKWKFIKKFIKEYKNRFNWKDMPKVVRRVYKTKYYHIYNIFYDEINYE